MIICPKADKISEVFAIKDNTHHIGRQAERFAHTQLSTPDLVPVLSNFAIHLHNSMMLFKANRNG
jgi:hypothetical protein